MLYRKTYVLYRLRDWLAIVRVDFQGKDKQLHAKYKQDQEHYAHFEFNIMTRILILCVSELQNIRWTRKTFNITRMVDMS
jgi:hypothetical protein